MCEPLPDAFPPDRVDVYLEPDPFAAEASLDIATILNAPLTFKNVEVRWITPRPQ